MNIDSYSRGDSDLSIKTLLSRLRNIRSARNRLESGAFPIKYNFYLERPELIEEAERLGVEVPFEERHPVLSDIPEATKRELKTMLLLGLTIGVPTYISGASVTGRLNPFNWVSTPDNPLPENTGSVVRSSLLLSSMFGLPVTFFLRRKESKKLKREKLANREKFLEDILRGRIQEINADKQDSRV